MSFLDNLYLEHYKKPRNYGILSPASISKEGLNPSCGDELKIFLNLEDGKIVDAKFTGEGCAISKASASLMTVAIKDKTLEEAQKLSTPIPTGVVTPIPVITTRRFSEF